MVGIVYTRQIVVVDGNDGDDDGDGDGNGDILPFTICHAAF